MMSKVGGDASHGHIGWLRLCSHTQLTKLNYYYSAPDRAAEYCDDRVCLSVRDHIFETTRPIFIKCFVHVLHRRSDTLHIVVFWQMTLFLQ